MDEAPKVLPGVLGEVAHLTNPQVAIALAKTFGGRKLFLPREIRRNHALVSVAGWKAARLIARTLHDRHGDTVFIPAIKPLLRVIEARRLRREGKSNSQIAQALGIGLRRVEAIIGGTERPDPAAPAAIAAEPPFCPCCGRRLGHRRTAGNPAQLTLPLAG